MSSDLRERLQTTLGTAYTLERELGGGGMSRVFLAEESRLQRKVVVKVLSPELAAGGTITHVGTMLGTPAYMVPEQVAGEPDTDSRADARETDRP
jgi:serine/threonine-protein kinase